VYRLYSTTASCSLGYALSKEVSEPNTRLRLSIIGIVRRGKARLACPTTNKRLHPLQ